MRKISLLLCCFATCSAFGQLDHKKSIASPEPKKEKIAVITGHMKNGPNDSLVQIFDAYNGTYDSTRMKNNRFTFKVPMEYGGSIFILKLGTNPDPEVGATLAYFEEGKMHIAGEGMELRKANYSGDKWVKEWREVWAMIDPATNRWKEFNGLEAKFRQASAIGDEDAATEYDRRGDSIQAKYKEEMLAWIRKHPNSGLSVYLMCYFHGKQEREEIFAMLGDHAKESRIYQRLKGTSPDPLPGITFETLDSAETVKSGVVVAGAVAPEFSAPDENGNPVSLSHFKGKYVFIDFWASWCGPCKPQIPFLKAAHDKFKSDNFVMLAVSLDKDKTAWQNAIKKHALNWTNLSSLKGWAEPAAKAYGVGYVPFNVLIGPDGKVLATGLYGADIDKKLTELIK